LVVLVVVREVMLLAPGSQIVIVAMLWRVIQMRNRQDDFRASARIDLAVFKPTSGPLAAIVRTP
jgi:acetamidase/formamidase